MHGMKEVEKVLENSVLKKEKGSVSSRFLFALVVDIVTEFARGCAK